MIPRHLMIAVSVLLTAALGMTLYVWSMRGRADRMETASTSSRPVAPPPTGPTEQVTLFVADDEGGTLRPRSVRIPLPSGRQERAAELLQALLTIYLDKHSPHALGNGSEIRDVYLVDAGLAVIDLNSAFADTHRSGILVEELTIASIVQTLTTDIPGITRVKFLVDGNSRDTLAGHADLSGFYDATSVSQLAAQLQNSQ